jgi:hypothetical protein
VRFYNRLIRVEPQLISHVHARDAPAKMPVTLVKVSSFKKHLSRRRFGAS